MPVRGRRSRDTPSFILLVRDKVWLGLIALSAAIVLAGIFLHALWWPLVVTVPLVLVGLRDVLQTRHSLLRNYPVIGHMRFLLEDMGPELHQYLVESNTDGRPFDRDTRSLIYERAKGVSDKKPFGTELDVYRTGYSWLGHSIMPKQKVVDAAKTLRVRIGGQGCERPYSSSVLNISAMSFGALSQAAIRAMNAGARRGGFAHDTGEGGLSRYHREPGGDVIWQIGTGYFGCRDDRGRFDRDLFAEQARLDQVKMIELKISQGAKPGHGGVLLGEKVTAEIAAARKVPVGADCISPARHSAFSTPREMMRFLDELRRLSGGKPVGFKLCIGRYSEFLAICKAMMETNLHPDFVVVDGGEGGTGAAPLELSDHVGMPLKEGLLFVRNALVGLGLRERVRIGCSGKTVTAAAIAGAMALGADWCNSARGFMFAVGCIQSQRCHTNQCPVGVATQDPKRQRALVVADKAERVYNFHRNTVEELAEILAALGLEHPGELRPHHVYERIAPNEIRTFAESRTFVEHGQILDATAPGWLVREWEAASADSFERCC